VTCLHRDASGSDRRVFMLEAAFWEAVVALTSEDDSATRPPPCVPMLRMWQLLLACLTSALFFTLLQGARVRGSRGARV
jgi:hypothetical protein